MVANRNVEKVNFSFGNERATRRLLRAKKGNIKATAARLPKRLKLPPTWPPTVHLRGDPRSSGGYSVGRRSESSFSLVAVKHAADISSLPLLWTLDSSVCLCVSRVGGSSKHQLSSCLRLNKSGRQSDAT